MSKFDSFHLQGVCCACLDLACFCTSESKLTFLSHGPLESHRWHNLCWKSGLYLVSFGQLYPQSLCTCGADIGPCVCFIIIGRYVCIHVGVCHVLSVFPQEKKSFCCFYFVRDCREGRLVNCLLQFNTDLLYFHSNFKLWRLQSSFKDYYLPHYMRQLQ